MLKKSKSFVLLLILLSIIFLVSFIAALKFGAVSLSAKDIYDIITNKMTLNHQVNIDQESDIIFTSIRLPRVLMAALVGATLAVCGGAMQATLRNPLADPGLLGISSGASLFVTASIVLGINIFGEFSLPLIAFLGSFFAMAFIFLLSKIKGQMSVTTIILSGIAINALFSALTSFFIFMSNNEQLRSITFWQLGSFGSTNWQSVILFSPFALITILGIPLLSKSLNALILGENNARLVGVNVNFIKNSVIFLVSLGVGASVAMCGVIGFVGLVVPHIIRLWIGPEHKKLFIASLFLGAILMVLADLVGRIIIRPNEIPIGVITAIIGAPFFLFLLLKNKRGDF